MIFDTHFWPLCICFAFMSAALTYWLSFSFLPGKALSSFKDYRKWRFDSQKQKLILLLGVFVVDLLAQRFNIYYQMPVLAGSFFGYWTQIFLALAPAVLVSCYVSRMASLGPGTLALVIVFTVPAIQSLCYTLGPVNSKRFADLPQIVVAKTEETIPPSDEKHLVQVTPEMAALKARTAISSKGNISTRFAVGELTLQSINGTRYYAAPLVPSNSNDYFWVPLFGGRSESPGYVLVNAEDKEAAPQLHDEFHINLFDDLPWKNNLERFAYQAGYTHGILDNSTFEVDDELQPHWTITYVTPAFGNIVGKKVSKVLIVDVATASPQIRDYSPGDKTYSWVDRVMSASIVKEYARDWGIYGQPFSNRNFLNWLQIVFGLSKQDTMVPADGTEGLMLTYTKKAENIWVIPMISQNLSNHGVIGVLVFETNRNKATFYPGLRGFNHGGSVEQTMFAAKDNGFQKYQIENLELYNIYGHLTWVAIYTRTQSLGSTFGAIGFMDAHSQEASDVAYGNSLQSALADYDSKLANSSNEGTGIFATQANSTTAFNSTIWRIAPNGSSWRFQLNGDSKHYFDVTTQAFAGAPLLHDGDHVSGTFMDTLQPQVAVRQMELLDAGPKLKEAIREQINLKSSTRKQK
jgi:hypothetical protein